ncbi:MAG TPA: hypothetical protein VK507_21495 [Iamia sp.]|nr:hypothetical protein [Iamia sp.]
MHRSRTLTGVAAIAVALVVIVGSAAPAAATGPHPLDVPGAQMVMAGLTIDTLPGDQGTPPCTQPADSLNLFAYGPPASRWTMSGGFSELFQLGNPPSGAWYQADFSILSALGTYAAGGPANYLFNSSGPNHVTMQVRIYAIPPCDRSVLRCVISMRMVMLNGYYTGTLPAVASGNQLSFTLTTNFTGGTPMSVSSCSAPFVSWGGQHASMSVGTTVI